MTRRTAFCATTLALVSLLLPVASAHAQARVPAPPTSIAEVALQDTLVRVDVAAGTVTLGGETFRVAGNARLVDEAGARLRLGTLAALGEGREVLFRARETRSAAGAPMRELTSLALMDGDFE